VLAYLWQRVVVDHAAAHLPQEFASALTLRGLGVHGDVIILGSQAGELLALRASDGKEIWRRKVGPVSSRPVLDGGRLYVGTDDGALVALDALDGEVRWRYAARGAILEPPVVYRDLIIFSTDADRVIALTRETGSWRWQYERETPEEFTVRGHAGVVLVGDRIYTGFADGYVVCLSATAGEVAWVRTLAGAATRFVDVNATPAVSGGVVFAASIAGGLYALDAADGTEKWHLDVQNISRLTAAGRALYVAAAEAGIYCLDLAGHVVWRQGLARAGDPGPLTVDGKYLFLPTSDKGLFIVDAPSGRLYQVFNPGAGVSAAPAFLDDRLFVLANAGTLYAMSVERF
jgi:outer membrane protein assembly factor BamB